MWLLLLAGCKTDYQHLPAFSKQKQLQMVVLTPAGSNHPQVYNTKQKEFVPVREAGLPKQIKFLPYPGNYGFIPSTLFKSNDAPEGKPLEVLLLAESVATGSVQEVIPIGTLLLEIAGAVNNIILAVPARPSEQVVPATDFESFTKDYPAAKQIIQQWFMHHQANQQIVFKGWKDEKYTEQLIRRWML